LLQGLSQYAPGAISSIANTLPATAQGQLSAAQSVEPGAENLYNQNQLASAQTEANVVGGPGQQLVNSANKYQQQTDPEFYAQRAALSNALTKYLGSYDPTKLTPTEEAQISRGINATTGPQTPSNMNTIRNAQTFGSAGTQRWQNFGNAVTQAAQALPALKSGINGFQVASSRGSNPFATNAATNALGSNFGFSSTALNDATGILNTVTGKAKDPYDKALAMSGAFKNIAGGVAGLGSSGGAGAGGGGY
jgi:hypothetical protein